MPPKLKMLIKSEEIDSAVERLASEIRQGLPGQKSPAHRHPQGVVYFHGRPGAQAGYAAGSGFRTAVQLRQRHRIIGQNQGSRERLNLTGRRPARCRGGGYHRYRPDHRLSSPLSQKEEAGLGRAVRPDGKAFPPQDGCENRLPGIYACPTNSSSATASTGTRNTVTCLISAILR